MLTGTTFTHSNISLALIMALLTSLIALPFQMIGVVEATQGTESRSDDVSTESSC